MKGLGGSTELGWGRCKRSASAGAEGICTSSFIVSGNQILAQAALAILTPDFVVFATPDRRSSLSE